MKLKALAPAALIMMSGYALAQDNASDEAANASPVTQSELPAAPGSSTAAGASASASANADFATADTDKDGKLSIAEMNVVLPGITINDLDADGYVNQKEVEASVTGLSFSSGSDTALITESDYDLIVGYLDDEAPTVIIPADGDDAEVEINVDGDVDVQDN